MNKNGEQEQGRGTEIIIACNFQNWFLELGRTESVLVGWTWMGKGNLVSDFIYATTPKNIKV